MLLLTKQRPNGVPEEQGASKNKGLPSTDKVFFVGVES